MPVHPTGEGPIGFLTYYVAIDEFAFGFLEVLKHPAGSIPKPTEWLCC
jgi:hypothetical protein